MRGLYSLVQLSMEISISSMQSLDGYDADGVNLC